MVGIKICVIGCFLFVIGYSNLYFKIPIIHFFIPAIQNQIVVIKSMFALNINYK